MYNISKHEILSTKHETNLKLEITKGERMAEREKKYDLEERTEVFAKRVRTFVRRLPRTISNQEDVRQLVRASGSVGANYIEANDSLGKKDFGMHIKICRKESKESGYWLRLLFTNDDKVLEAERVTLVQEARELTNIFGAILRNSQ